MKKISLLKSHWCALGVVFCSFNFSCKKEVPHRFSDASMKQLKVTLPPNLPPVFPIAKCINSYAQLISELKTNSVQVRRIILYDGTLINTVNGIIRMTYKAIDLPEAYSLFRSEFKAVYNFYGYQQENTTNAWSLGCVYDDAGRPPFTMLLKGKNLLLINTLFVWSLPGGNGRIITL